MQRTQRSIPGKLLSAFLLFVVLGLFAFAAPRASAETLEGTCGDNVTWVLDTSAGTLTVSGTGPMKDYEYYSSVPWADHRSSIKKIVVNSGVTYIGECAFNMWATSTSLTSVSLPDTVTSIGAHAFMMCSNLESCYLHDGITTIGKGAFSNCKSLKMTRLPASLTALGENVFNECESIGPVLEIPAGVTKIPTYAFYKCAGIKSITIPEGVTSIGGYAFQGMSIQKLTIPSTVGPIGRAAFSDNKFLVFVDMKGGTSLVSFAFSSCESLKKINFHKLVELTGELSFFGCNSLTYLSFPASVKSISDPHCSALETVCIVNPECTVSGSLGTVGQVTIYGESGSGAEEYAKNRGYAFKLLGTQPEEPADPVIEEEEDPGNEDEPENPNAPQFKDVPANAYYADAVAWAVANNITSGISNTAFAPNSSCTRAQIVTFLWRAAGKPEPKTTANPFRDVKSGSYYYKAVLWAVENGITSGTSSTTFSPEASCTRAQAVSFLWRAKNKPSAPAASSFKDVKAGSYYAEAVNWAVANQITSGVSATSFGPNQACTRAQIVTFLYRDMK